MRYREFIERVQELGQLESENDAVRITEATLETLGEELYAHRTALRHLVSQLPEELKEPLLRRKGGDHPLLDEFYNRVRARADIGYPDAVRLAKVVVSVLQEAVAPGEMRHVLDELPPEYTDFFEEASESPAS